MVIIEYQANLKQSTLTKIGLFGAQSIDVPLCAFGVLRVYPAANQVVDFCGPTT